MVLKLPNSNHVILVDDNRGDVVLAEECMAMSKLNNPWLAFSNGADFLVYLEQVKAQSAPVPALVLLDINMRAMHGFEVLSRAKREFTFANGPLYCMFSSSADPKDRERARVLGADEFITKFDDIHQFIAFFDALAARA